MLKVVRLQQIISFCGTVRSRQDRDARRGNLHQVALVEEFSDSLVAKEYSKSIYPLIYVETCLDERGIAHLAYYHSGREVQNCGSGTLAAAAFWNAENPQVICYRNRVIDGRFLRNELLFGYTQNGLNVFKPINNTYNFWRCVCGCAINRVTAVVGKSYVIVELPSQRAVKRLKPRLTLLKKSPLALIVTARSKNPNIDYVARYFAPQYGNDEDAATGSANCVLAQYWQSIAKKRRRVRGLQLSKQGGEFIGCVKSKEVQLYGNTVMI